MTKEQAHKLVDQMPAQATWDDLMREIYVRHVVEQGLAIARWAYKISERSQGQARPS